MSDQSAPDPYDAVLADLRAQQERITQTIVLLESLRGRASASSSPDALQHAPVGSAPPGPGEFLGMTIVDAAKKLLLRERRAMGNAEILAGLERGGLVLKSADPINVVSSVMTRRFGQIGDVVRVARGTWGLKEWYPNRSFKAPTKTNIADLDSHNKVASDQGSAGIDNPTQDFADVASADDEAPEAF